MNDPNRLTHSIWDCKYHIVWIPKCRRKRLHGGIAKDLGKIFHELARQRECKIEQGHVCPDHIHMLIEISPKYVVSAVVGYITENNWSLHRKNLQKSRNFGKHGE